MSRRPFERNNIMPQEIALPRDFWDRLPLRSDEELHLAGPRGRWLPTNQV